MSDRDPLRRKSHTLSRLLRHAANEARLHMDAAGFAPVAEVLRAAHMTLDELRAVVAENNKTRYELTADGQRIRASQGHSLAGTPVTLEGLEASWQVVTDDAPVFHGTSVGAARAILASGAINAGERTHVHLAPATDSVVGKRAAVDVLLEIEPARLRAAGQTLFRAPNGVLLTRAVPTSALVNVRGSTNAGRAAEGELRALLASRP
jgi:putative RNA 2'-phosphotransferase